MHNILITGGAGFIGSNLVHFMCDKHPDYKIINLDALTYASHYEEIAQLESLPHYNFVKGNICDREFITDIFDEYDINGVIHLAAESHVDNSIEGPEIFLQTNVMGTFNILDAARRKWMTGPKKYKSEYKDSRFLHVSTDEVYGSLGDEGQ